MSRPSFEEAKRIWTNRFTCEHIPEFGMFPREIEGRLYYPAPEFISDEEWYEKTSFFGEFTYVPPLKGQKNIPQSGRQSYPFGRWLTKPFKACKVQFI